MKTQDKTSLITASSCIRRSNETSEVKYRKSNLKRFSEKVDHVK